MQKWLLEYFHEHARKIQTRNIFTHDTYIAFVYPDHTFISSVNYVYMIP